MEAENVTIKDPYCIAAICHKDLKTSQYSPTLLNVPRQSLASQDVEIEVDRNLRVTPIMIESNPNRVHHQRCESGSTGYSYPEPANSDSIGLPRPHQRSFGEAANSRPKKRVQFHNLVTEPELLNIDYSNLEEVEPVQTHHSISREDTMVERSVVVNEDENVAEADQDYFQALQSVKFDNCAFNTEPALQSGEYDVFQIKDGSSGGGISRDLKKNNFLVISSEEDRIIEQSLIQIRNRIRSGLPLSHQIHLNDIEVEDLFSKDCQSQPIADTKLKKQEYSEEKSENVLSSGLANFRLSKVPIGTVESSHLGLFLSSKPSHKNNNLSKKEIHNMRPKNAQSLMCDGMKFRKHSPSGILKSTTKFSRELSTESAKSKLDHVREVFQQPLLPASRRQQETRIHQSVTYSPVSHCITRDAANIFEKKKLRMQKIQKLRGVSNQSETLSLKALSFEKLETKQEENQQKDNQIEKNQNRIGKAFNLQKSIRKYTTSLPQTPRKVLLSTKQTGTDIKEEEKNQIKPNKENATRKAPPVNGKISNAHISVHTKKKATGQSKISAINVEEYQRRRDGLSANRQFQVNATDISSLKQNLLKIQLNQSSSIDSMEQQQPQVPRMKVHSGSMSKGVQNALLSLRMSTETSNNSIQESLNLYQPLAAKSKIAKQPGIKAKITSAQINSKAVIPPKAQQKLKSKQMSQVPNFDTELLSELLKNLLAIDPSIFKKLKIVANEGQVSKRTASEQRKEPSISSNSKLGKISGASNSKNDYLSGLKQKESSSGKKSTDKSSIHAKTSRSLAAHWINQLILNVVSSKTPQTPLLKKEQVLLLLQQHFAKADKSQQQSQYLSTSKEENKVDRQVNKTKRNTKSNLASILQSQIARHQRCESGSTGHSFPEPANSDSTKLSRLNQISFGQAANSRPIKRVQFNSVVTEPELLNIDYSNLEEVEPVQTHHSISREDTMVERSVVLNEDENVADADQDYFQALQSVKFDNAEFNTAPALLSGECDVLQVNNGSSDGGLSRELNKNNFLVFSSEEDRIIEQSLIQIRNRIRSGLPLSHQIPLNDIEVEDLLSKNCQLQQIADTKLKKQEYSEEKSENVLSSGLANFRLSKVPIGTVESSHLGLVLSSKPSHKNNNLSKKEIHNMRPKNAQSLMCDGKLFRKHSPSGILKSTMKFSREQSTDSANSKLVHFREAFQQPSLPALRRHQETRIHQSVTYSPVSHCVTRDAANIFEKKKLRMQKIQKLRGVSNQSETLSLKAPSFEKIETKQQENQQTDNSIEKNKNTIGKVLKLQKSNRKYTTSLPQTPRKVLLSTKQTGTGIIEEEKNQIKPNKSNATRKAPQVNAKICNAQICNAQISIHKKKKGTGQAKISAINVEEYQRRRDGLSANRQFQVNAADISSLKQNLLKIQLNQSSSIESMEQQQPQVPRMKVHSGSMSKGVQNALLSLRMSTETLKNSIQESFNLYQPLAAKSKISKQPGTKDKKTTAQINSKAVILAKAQQKLKSKQI